MDKPATPKVHVPEVPPELLKKLHEVTERFHQRRQEHERAMENTEYDHGEHIEEARRLVQDAERELEEVNRQIKDELDKPGSG